MKFTDRREAGKLLAKKISGIRYEDVVVMAIPRGGVPVGYEISQSLYIPMEIIVVRKVGHPKQPELAVCAVTESRYVQCDKLIKQYLNQEWLKRAVVAEQKEAARRRLVYGAGRNLVKWLNRKEVLVVDDGIATGLTMHAAVKAIKDCHPKRVAVVAPVVSKEAFYYLENKVDNIIALDIPDDFTSVGIFYKNFSQLSDETVVALLHQSKGI